MPYRRRYGVRKHYGSYRKRYTRPRRTYRRRR